MKRIVFIITLCIGACNTNVEGDSRAIEAMIKDLIAADNRGDLESVLSHYTIDATLMPPGKASLRGQENLRKNYQNIFASTLLHLETSIEGIEINKTSAIAWGFNTGSAISKKDSSARQINDKYFMQLLKKNGEWKIVRLIWNQKR